MPLPHMTSMPHLKVFEALKKCIWRPFVAPSAYVLNTPQITPQHTPQDSPFMLVRNTRAILFDYGQIQAFTFDSPFIFTKVHLLMKQNPTFTSKFIMFQ